MAVTENNPEGIITDINEMSEELKEQVLSAILDGVKNLATEIIMRDYKITSEIVLQLASELKNITVQADYLNPTSGARFLASYYREYGIHWCTRYTPVYLDKIRNIYRKQKIYRVYKAINGELVEPTIYKSVNGEIKKVWEV